MREHVVHDQIKPSALGLGLTTTHWVFWVAEEVPGDFYQPFIMYFCADKLETFIYFF